jgi:hypothetical protein
MRSSISSSEANARVYIKILLAICVMLLASVELWARYSLPRHSMAYRRVGQQYGEAIQSRWSHPGEPASVLMVGNSLLLDGIDVARLQKSTAGRLQIYPVFLEGTHYYDWLYGLRRLFRHGARPQVLVVGLGMESLLENSVRPESPMLLFDARDVVDASSDLGLDRTATFNLLLSHWSVFWDTRRVIRLNILRRGIPGAQEFFTRLNKPPGSPNGSEFEAVATSRLRTLRHLGETYGARVVLLIPPWSTSPDSVPQAIAAARKAGLETLVPVDPRVVPAAFYAPDTIHLNPKGAALFTTALETDLPRKIAALNIVTSRRH